MRFKTFFKDLIDPSIIVGIVIIFAVTIILTVFFSSKVEGFKQKYKGKFITYIIIVLLVTALTIFIGSSEVFNNQIFSIFIFYQIVFFILGIIHSYVYRNYFEKFEKESPWIEMFFSLIVTIYILIPFLLVYTIVKGNTYVYSMMFSSLVFMIPTVIYLTFEASIAIPPKIYKTWLFPEEHAYPDPPDSEYRDMLVVTFVFHKEPDSEVRTEFRAKAPIRMDFGRLFYHFVNDYNLRNPDAPINLMDKNGEKQHWVFYLKNKSFGFAKFIRPDYPLYMNSIEENSVIICRRTPPLLNSEDELDYDMKDNKIEENPNIDEKQKKDNF
ncbi:TssN family type VI secretion system protein [Apibacter sp. HY039]|uniref:TssN family type VI secretion system protein n=1 Tax=Apibacter sp. HY039 TaxID=2501476 RepID=UPI000FEBE76A|nr:TssN family type VI secretion system protein [Apibacter sp. HY039]